jgi:hypothetical protein
VLLTQYVLNKEGISLKEKTFFDYGFGAGTFFRYCPSSTQHLQAKRLKAMAFGENPPYHRNGDFHPSL